MTRAEAQRILATWLVSSEGADGQLGYIEGWFDEDDAEAFRMAIEALTQESRKVTQESTQDLISRQDAILWVKTECNPYGKPTLDFESGKKVIEHLKQMPSADRPTGEWIEVNHVVDTTCECSECHYRDYIPNVETETDKYECMDRYWFERKYCPNCGAKMR